MWERVEPPPQGRRLGGRRQAMSPQRLAEAQRGRGGSGAQAAALGAVSARVYGGGSALMSHVGKVVLCGARKAEEPAAHWN